jgi:hypothetical protein
MLNSNGSQNTQTSSSGNLRTLEPQPDRSSSKSPLSEHSSTDLIKAPPTQYFASDIEKGLSFPQKGKSKTLPLTPVISAFSTYKKTPSGNEKGIREKGISLPIAAWKNSHPLPSPFDDAAHNSSNASLSSFDTGLSTDQSTSGGLKAPKHAKREESTQVLVGNVTSSGKDDGNSDGKQGK